MTRGVFYDANGPSGAAAEPGSGTSGFAELSEGILPPAEPTPAAAGGQPQPTAEAGAAIPAATAATPAAAAPSAPAPTAAAAATPAPRKYRVGGKEYTVAELEASGLLDQMDINFLKAEQVRHYQELYETEKAKTATPAPAPAVDPGPSNEQIIATYSPQVAAAVQAGILEEEVAAAYPKTAARMLYLADIVARNGALLDGLLKGVSTAYSTDRLSKVHGRFKAAADAVAARGSIYQPLADAKVRDEFRLWVSNNVNLPTDDAITEQMIASQWAAFKHEEILQAATAAATVQKTAEDEKRKNAIGEGSDARGGGPVGAKTQLEKDMDEMSAGYLPSLGVAGGRG